MNREFEFRVWDKVENKYFEPIYEGYKGNLLDLSISLTGRLIRRTIELPAEDESLFPDRYIIEQYTGLTDKKEVKIFEGDVVRAAPNYTYVIRWENGAFYAYRKTITDNGQPYRWGLISRFNELCIDIEVIGNIHDNPELIK